MYCGMIFIIRANICGYEHSAGLLGCPFMGSWFDVHVRPNLIKIRSFGPLPQIATKGSNEAPYKG